MSERCQHEHKHSSCQKGVTIWNRLHLLSERCYNLKQITPLVRKVLQSETDYTPCQKGVTIWNRLHLLSERCYNLKQITPLVRKVLQSETDYTSCQKGVTIWKLHLLSERCYNLKQMEAWGACAESTHKVLTRTQAQILPVCCDCFCLQKHWQKNGLKRSTKVYFSRLCIGAAFASSFVYKNTSERTVWKEAPTFLFPGSSSTIMLKEGIGKSHCHFQSWISYI